MSSGILSLGWVLPHPATAYIKGPIKGYIYPYSYYYCYYYYYPTVTGGGSTESLGFRVYVMVPSLVRLGPNGLGWV